MKNIWYEINWEQFDADFSKLKSAGLNNPSAPKNIDKDCWNDLITILKCPIKQCQNISPESLNRLFYSISMTDISPYVFPKEHSYKLIGVERVKKKRRVM